MFTPDADIDYTASGGIAGAFRRGEALAGRDAADLPPAPSTPSARSTSCWQATTATVTAYFHNPMVLPREDGTEHLVELGGLYHHLFRRTPDGWRSRRLVEEIVWKRGI